MKQSPKERRFQCNRHRWDDLWRHDTDELDLIGGVLNGPRQGGVALRMLGYPMSELARYLQVHVGRVVVDRTGITGTFDINLEFSLPTVGLLASPDQAPSPQEAVPLFTAIEEQLGLKLLTERGPVQVLIVDHAERPTPN